MRNAKQKNDLKAFSCFQATARTVQQSMENASKDFVNVRMVGKALHVNKKVSVEIQVKRFLIRTFK